MTFAARDQFVCTKLETNCVQARYQTFTVAECSTKFAIAERYTISNDCELLVKSVWKTGIIGQFDWDFQKHIWIGYVKS